MLPASRNARRKCPAGLAWQLLGAALLVVVGSTGPAAGADEPARPVRVSFHDEQPQVELVDLPTDPAPRIIYQFSQNMRVGFQLMSPVGQVRITCGTGGETNNTTCRIDSSDVEFGGPAGRWDPQQAPLAEGAAGRKRQGTRSSWVYGKIRITQIVEIVSTRAPRTPGGTPAKRLRDTCVLRYLIENGDSRPHQVGIRNMIDTLIVNNDGAQFADAAKGQILPGGDFRTTKVVPAHVLVLERPDLKNPGVVAHISTRLGGRIDPADRLILTRWPGSGVGWEVPAQQAAFDTAYAIYWNPKAIPAGGKREVGFAYGGGFVNRLEDGGRLQMALGGSFAPGKVFTITAYVESPLEGQSLTLELPPAMARLEGQATQPVPQPLASGISVVLWKGSVRTLGQHPVRVRSSTGYVLTRTVTVAPPRD
jgi:hypothetical protein